MSLFKYPSTLTEENGAQVHTFEPRPGVEICAVVDFVDREGVLSIAIQGAIVQQTEPAALTTTDIDALYEAIHGEES